MIRPEPGEKPLICYKTDIGKRENNEDSLLVKKIGEFHVLAVADGLGGHAAGEVASRVALIEIEEYLRKNLSRENLKEAVREAILKANREICMLSRENPEYRGMGTTLVLAIVFGNRALIANVGDSRAYLIGDGIRRITKDHSLVQELVDRKIITEEEAFNHPQKNVVTNALGIGEDVTIDFYEVELDGYLLLCTDGLSDYVRDREIKDVVLKAQNPCDELVRIAKERGNDNITVILMRAKGNSFQDASD